MASNQKYNASGTTYSITGGKYNVSGTSYNITHGKYNTGSTSYWINFAKPVNNVYTAQLYNNGHLQFQVNDRNEATSSNPLKGSYTGFINASYNNTSRPWAAQMNNIKTVAFDATIAPTDLRYWMYRCNNLTSFNWDNLDLSQVTNMYGMFDYAEKVVLTPQVGPNVQCMAFTYENCKSIVTAPVTGPNVTNMRYAYSNCFKLTGAPVCSDKVTSFEGAYYYCNSLTGAPAIGPNINSAGMAYYCCSKLRGPIIVPEKLDYIRYLYGYCGNVTGSPQCSNNVVNFHGAYACCYNLSGDFVCGSKVSDMDYTYQGCSQLTGDAIIGPNVKTAVNTYQLCPQITNAGILSNNVSNMKSCFAGKYNNTRLNIYANFGTTTWNTLLKTDANSIVGANITWTNTNKFYYYNTAYNVYIINNAYITYIADKAYLATDTMYFINSIKDSTFNMSNTVNINAAAVYTNDAQVPWHAWRSKIKYVYFNRPIEAVSTNYWFNNCKNLSRTYNTLIQDKVSASRMMYGYCSNFVGPMSIGPQVTDMYYAFASCSNNPGPPTCPGKVTNMYYAYQFCWSMTDPPVCGDRVTNFRAAYYGCYNMKGLPVFGPNVRDASGAYNQSFNLCSDIAYPRIIIPPSVTNLYSTFNNCVNFGKNCSAVYVNIQCPSVTNMVNCFRNCAFNSTHPLVINAIRECSSKIEKYGYKIDVEEYDLSTLYQVVFKIEKAYSQHKTQK